MKRLIQIPVVSIPFLFLSFCFLSCSEGTLTNVIYPSENDKIKILPDSPASNDEVKIVTYDCRYYSLASVTIRQKEIEVKKHYNSQMKLPCILVNDTVTLGRLNQGTYNVILLIIDINPMVKDTVHRKETFSLTVRR